MNVEPRKAAQVLFGLRSWLAQKLKGLHVIRQDFKQDLGFEAGNELTDTNVNPRTKPTCPMGLRVTSNFSGSGHLRGSRLAAPRNSNTFCALPGPPRRPTSRARVVVRKKVCTGESQRKTSSKAGLSSERSARRRCHWSGRLQMRKSHWQNHSPSYRALPSTTSAPGSALLRRLFHRHRARPRYRQQILARRRHRARIEHGSRPAPARRPRWKNGRLRCAVQTS